MTTVKSFGTMGVDWEQRVDYNPGKIASLMSMGQISVDHLVGI